MLALGLAGLMAFGIVASLVMPETMMSTAEKLMDGLRGGGFTGAGIFIGSVVIIALSGIFPMSVLAVVAGAEFGLLIGFILLALSAIAGAVLAFFLSRSVFRPVVERLMARRPRLSQFDSQICRNG
jgi:uncharacterized membrane protein YdjX (TVP38/TMEM64 family)